MTRGTTQRRLAAFSLLELIMAAAILAATLVPALRILRGSMDLSDEIDRREMMATYCAGKLEEHLAIVAASWAEGIVFGDFAADGEPDLRYAVVYSDSVADGGVDDRLMHVTVTVYDDADKNDSMGAGERNVVYRTKVAKMATYENEAN